MAEERLQKLLARAGIASRRACEELIVAGRVSVDGEVVTQLGTRVDHSKALVCVDGAPISVEKLRYIMLNKPTGYLSSPDPRAGYPAWQALVKVPERLYPVGRLDHDSEGLLLLTNDGELAQMLAHPRYEHAKTYLVQVSGRPNARKIRRMQHGVMLEDGPTAPADVVLLRQPPAVFSAPPAGPDPGNARRPAASWLQVTIREGRKRQVRRMVALLGHPALRLIRIGLGPLQLGELPPGKWRDLSVGEVKALHAIAVREPAGKDTARAGDGPRPVSKQDSQAISRIPSVIAIDGPSSSGKSTVGCLLAQRLGYRYLDTGVMYRAVAALVVTRHVSADDEMAVTHLAEGVKLEIMQPTIADGRDVTVKADGADVTWELRRPDVEAVVSQVSAYPGVRRAMAAQQRALAGGGRIVMVGRDIGTVILPDADLKVYLTADLEERASRRYQERLERRESPDLDQIRADMKRRDELDSKREHSPLAAARDAIVIDTTGLSLSQVMARLTKLVRGQPGPTARRQPRPAPKA